MEWIAEIYKGYEMAKFRVTGEDEEDAHANAMQVIHDHYEGYKILRLESIQAYVERTRPGLYGPIGGPD